MGKATNEYDMFAQLKAKDKEEFMMIYGSRVQRNTLEMTSMFLPLNIALASFILRSTNEIIFGWLLYFLAVVSLVVIWWNWRRLGEDAEEFLYACLDE